MRLLVVEDAPKMSAVLERAFREDGYAVDVQASGNDAVWMASECDFDAVILDVGLPDGDASLNVKISIRRSSAATRRVNGG